VLPAAKSANVADVELVHGEVAAVSFAKDGALDVGWLELAARVDDLAVASIDGTPLR